MKLFQTIILSIGFSCAALQAEGQFFDFAGSRSQALAGASAGQTGCWSAFSNQAGIADLVHPEIAIAFQNRFLVYELSDRIGLFALPFRKNVFAVSFYQFGEIPFRREKLGLAYARRISPKIRFGLQFNYFCFYFPEANRSGGSAGLELGFQYQAGSKVNFGLHITNPYQTSVKIYSGKYHYPSRISLGFQYSLSESCSWMAQVENDFDRQFLVKSGFEYDIQEKLFLRIGVATNPYQLSSGIGLRFRKMKIDLGNSFHAYLGNSPSVSLSYPIGR